MHTSDYIPGPLHCCSDVVPFLTCLTGSVPAACSHRRKRPELNFIIALMFFGASACRYTQESTAIRYFLEVISELDAADQRRFLRFVTGSPRLPPGGLASLHPRCAFIVTACLYASRRFVCFAGHMGC